MSHEEEFKEFLRWLDFPDEKVRQQPECPDMLIKALGLGLADISIQKRQGKCSATIIFASDIREILQPLNQKCCRTEYRKLKKFREKLMKLILLYGVIGLESLYEMYQDIDPGIMDSTTFKRYVYWHARFNNLVQTTYTLKQEVYVGDTQLDMEGVLHDMRKYAEDLDYIRFPASVIKKMTQDISERNRIQYGEEKGISPWQTGMLEHEQNRCDGKECHIHEFSANVQEAMHNAGCYADPQAMDSLMRYKEREHVKSEEFLFLLTDAHITGGRFAEARKLIRELEKSAGWDKDSIAVLRRRLNDGEDVMDEDEVFDFEPWSDYGLDIAPVQQPYVRKTPKIGRNDPCPCGSGKKYKKCCGR